MTAFERKKGRLQMQAAQFREETPKEGSGSERYRTATK